MVYKTLCVFGTRPEAIKMAPIIKQLNVTTGIQNKVCVTGQHLNMLDSVLNLFKISTDFNLQVMSSNQSLSGLTAKILNGLERVFQQYKPDLVLVHGDTTTTLAASLSAYYHHVDVAHIEAGLRTGNIHSPWPEEANRKLTGGLASIHFAPTLLSRNNLLQEGVAAHTVHLTGNTVIDSLYEMIKKFEDEPELRNKMQYQFPFLAQGRRMLLVTGHRRESFGEGFERICHALMSIARLFPELDIVYPVHLNPNVQQPVKSLLADIKNIYLLEPVDYLSFIYLMKSSYLILTDSGGVQEEAPSLGKPVLVMRTTTERPEALEAGTVTLVGTDVEQIVTHVRALLTDADRYSRMSRAQNPYGDGQAAPRIVQVIQELGGCGRSEVVGSVSDLAESL